jgi:hypothetical protein
VVCSLWHNIFVRWYLFTDKYPVHRVKGTLSLPTYRNIIGEYINSKPFLVEQSKDGACDFFIGE